MTRSAIDTNALLLAVLAASITLGIEWYVAGVVIRPFDFLLLLGLVTILGPSIIRGRIPRLYLNEIVLLFFLVQIISFMNAALLTSPGRGFVNALQAFELLAAYYLFTTTLRTPKSLVKFFDYFLFVLWLVAIYAALYHFSQGDYVRFKNLDEPKLTFGILVLLTALKLLLTPHLRTYLFPILLVVSIGLLLASGERKGWAALLIASSGLIVFSIPLAFGRIDTRFLKRVFLVPIILIVPSVLLLQVPYVQKQIGASTTFAAAIVSEAPSGEVRQVTLSNEARLFFIDRAYEMIREHPITGVGTERFAEEILGWRPYVRHNLTGVHNEYLRIAAENGIPALLLFATMWVLIILRGIQLGRLSLRPGGDPFLGYAALGFAIYVTTLVALLKAGLVPDFLTLLAISVLNVQLIFAKRPTAQGTTNRSLRHA